ncbi:MAG TPA: TetR/AcrR family transcriptional regulator [Candidatus Goldiibacteriota bacterium]|nr:TetR/AcrR family transcriptional regulator [Candidatus Goldiibacteriota bacterium]HPI02335.1 TetR/AcrR family transcriptional regulator [Candidatus Goldiibacteriota bacterium]HPN64039.1 TetR/AcrR family transcriptional regulator [Candidatus Goldiibacteriota bacterium]HRQ43012.1 TetR/AcrR family transcriptional regulator [Candidatus Goldiibacteriota bacterium]
MVSKQQDPEKELKAKERILKAASDEFVEYGFYGARTQRIGDRAGVNKALLHYYFSSKEKIYEQVLRTVFGILIERINAIDFEKNSGIEEVMSSVLDIYEKMFDEYGSYLKLLVYEVISGAKYLPKIIFDNFNQIPFNPVNGKLYKYLKKNMKEGKLRKVNIYQFLISFIVQLAPVYLVKPVAEDVAGKIGFDRLLVGKFIKERKKYIMDTFRSGMLTDVKGRKK